MPSPPHSARGTGTSTRRRLRQRAAGRRGGACVRPGTGRRSSSRPRSGSPTTDTTRHCTGSTRVPEARRRPDRPADPAPAAAGGVRQGPGGLPGPGDAARRRKVRNDSHLAASGALGRSGTSNGPRACSRSRMHPAGIAEMERAKADGRWAAAYPRSQKIEVSPDLALPSPPTRRPGDVRGHQQPEPLRDPVSAADRKANGHAGPTAQGVRRHACLGRHDLPAAEAVAGLAPDEA